MPIRFAMRPTGSGGGGGAYYRFSKSGTVQLAAGEEVEIIPSTSFPVRREISIKGENPFSIRWDGSDRSLPVFEDATYFDSSDGGISLFATSATTQTVELWVRQETEIDYDLGSEIEDDMPIPDLSIRPFIPLDSNMGSLPSFVESDWSIESSAKTAYRQFWGDWERPANSAKAWQFDVFLPGQQYVFNLSNNLFGDFYDTGTIESLIKEGSNIEILLCPRETMWMAISQIAMFSNFFDFDERVRYLEQWIRSRCSVVTVPYTGGAFNLTPTMSQYILFFSAEASNLYDGLSLCYCTYTPNSADPKQGGDFEIMDLKSWSW